MRNLFESIQWIFNARVVQTELKPLDAMCKVHG